MFALQLLFKLNSLLLAFTINLENGDFPPVLQSIHTHLKVHSSPSTYLPTVFFLQCITPISTFFEGESGKMPSCSDLGSSPWTAGKHLFQHLEHLLRSLLLSPWCLQGHFSFFLTPLCLCIFLLFLIYLFLGRCCSLAVAGNKGPRSCSLSITPPPAGVGRRIERKRQKNLVGRDKGGLTEQQTKGTVTPTI